MEGYIVVELIDQFVVLHYTKKFSDALKFIITRSIEIKKNGGDISRFDLEAGMAFGETKYGCFWSLEVRAVEDLDII